jgi:phage gp36-like protein
MEDVWGTQEVLTAFDRNGDASVDATALAEALDQATSEIDSYVGVAYDLPLASTPKILTRFCCDMAMYLGSIATAYTDEKRRRYEDARSWLKALAEGKAALGLTDEPTPRGEGASFSAGTRIFTRTTMGGL